MSRKRKRRKEPPVEPPSLGTTVLRGLQSLDDDGRRRWLRRIGVGVCLIVAGIAIARGLSFAADHVRAHSVRGASLRFELHDVPDWAAEMGLPHELESSLHSVHSRSLLDPTLTSDLAGRLSENPWVQRVVRVDKCYGGKIKIRCAYRRPVATVSIGSETAWVDADRVRLPALPIERLHLFRIEGITSPPPEVGKPWPGADMAAAIELAGMLLNESFAEQIDALVFTNFRGRVNAWKPQIELRTVRDRRLIWGSAPGEEVEEPLAEQKLALLRELHREYGEVDMNAAWINLTRGPDRVGRGRADAIAATDQTP